VSVRICHVERNIIADENKSEMLNPTMILPKTDERLFFEERMYDANNRENKKDVIPVTFGIIASAFDLYLS